MADDDYGPNKIVPDNPTAPDMKGAMPEDQEADNNVGGTLGALGLRTPRETDVDEGFDRFKRAQGPGMAKGGRPKPGKPVLVGEKGPEAFIPDPRNPAAPTSESSSMDAMNKMGIGLAPGAGGAHDNFPDDGSTRH